MFDPFSTAFALCCMGVGSIRSCNTLPYVKDASKRRRDLERTGPNALVVVADRMVELNWAPELMQEVRVSPEAERIDPDVRDWTLTAAHVHWQQRTRQKQACGTGCAFVPTATTSCVAPCCSPLYLLYCCAGVGGACCFSRAVEVGSAAHVAREASDLEIRAALRGLEAKRRNQQKVREAVAEGACFWWPDGSRMMWCPHQLTENQEMSILLRELRSRGIEVEGLEAPVTEGCISPCLGPMVESPTTQTWDLREDEATINQLEDLLDGATRCSTC